MPPANHGSGESRAARSRQFAPAHQWWPDWVDGTTTGGCWVGGAVDGAVGGLTIGDGGVDGVLPPIGRCERKTTPHAMRGRVSSPSQVAACLAPRPSGSTVWMMIDEPEGPDRSASVTLSSNNVARALPFGLTASVGNAPAVALSF